MKWLKVSIYGRQVSIAFDENSIHIYDAYPIKDTLKLRGYRWNPDDKSWYIKPTNVEEELAVLENDSSYASDIKLVKQGTDLAKFPHSYSVVELRNRINELIKEGISGHIWIRGVIASELKNYAWGSYFDLKDEDENRDIFFRVEVKKDNLESINQKLKNVGIADSLEKDLPVFCLAEVHLSLRYVVDVRLTILDVLPEYTQAKIRNQREITIEKLKSEGILDNQKFLTLPFLTLEIGLVTSELGTSIKDVMAGLHPFENKFNFHFIDTRMEGSQAIDSIITTLDYLEKDSGITLDAIILVRGGGSEQSLMVFNDFRLCRRICHCSIPILTAIGHEKDISATEICSHYTPIPATPSGLGQYLQERYINIQQKLSDSLESVIDLFLNIRIREIEKIKFMIKTLPLQLVKYFEWHEERMRALIHKFEQLASFLVVNKKRDLANNVKGVLKNSEIHLKEEERYIRDRKEAVLAQSNIICQRGIMQLEKLISRFDFHKRFRENYHQKQEIYDFLKLILHRGRKMQRDYQANLKSRLEFIKANHPDQILKRGFSLVLDEKNVTIPSLRDFKKVKEGYLKFHDGITGIIRKEEK